jgi:branched-chain amino acid transport system substrate-binding protein
MNNKWKMFWAVIVVIVIILILSVGNNAEKDSKQIKIGVIAPLSGDFAGAGENFVNGIKTAKAVYEEKTGNKVDLIIENDGGEATKGLSAFKKLTDVDKVNGLINVFTTTMDAIYEPSKDLPYPVLMGFLQANNVADDHVFQITLGNENVWNRYAEYLEKADFDKSNLVIVHSKDAAQESFAKEFAKFYKGKTETITASSEKGMLKSDAAKIVELKPSAVIFFMTPENGAILTKELLPLLDTKVQLIYDIQIHTGINYYKDVLGDLNKINGAISIIPEGEPNQEFIAKYKEVIGKDPGFTSDFGYDAFMTYLESYDKDESDWTENLKDTDLNGASGRIKFDNKGIVFPNLTIKVVENGEMKVAERLPFK